MADRGSDSRRVVVTGIGALTPIGITHDALWDGLRSHRSAVRNITRFDPSIYRSQIAAEIDFYPTDFLEERRARRLDRFGQFTVACARLADRGLGAQDGERRSRTRRLDDGKRARRRRIRRGAIQRLQEQGIKAVVGDAGDERLRAARRAATWRSSSARRGPNSTNAHELRVGDDGDR